MLAIIFLALACLFNALCILSINNKVNMLEAYNDVEELRETVDSHWSATQREINIIWGNINGVEYYDGEEEKEEETNGEDGAAEM